MFFCNNPVFLHKISVTGRIYLIAGRQKRMVIFGILFLIAMFMYLLACGAASLGNRAADDQEQAEYLKNLHSARQSDTGAG